MNKTGFRKAIQEKTFLDDSKMDSVMEVLDENFFIGKNSKERIINGFITRALVDEDKAKEIYDVAMSTIAINLKNKIKHPFKKIDN